MKKFIYFIAFIFSCTICYSQYTLEWAQRFNGQGNGQDAGYAIAMAPNGNICVAGSTVVTYGYPDLLTAEYDQQGNLLWSASYNGPGDSADIASAVAVDNSGNVYVTGMSGGNSGTYRDFVTVKYNSSGVQQWVQRYNGPGNGLDNPTGIITDNSGNVYVVGYSRVSGTFEDYVTIKYNSAGVQQWVQRYNGPGGYGDWARGVDLDNSGNIYVTGESVGSGTSIDYCTLKYDPSGTQLWAARYHGTGNYYDYATAIAVDNAGNAYVTGYTYSGSVTQQDYCTIKYNTNGVQQWLSTYNAPANSWEEAFCIAVDNTGNVYVSGWAVGANSGTDYCTIKYNISGQEQWVRTYNGPGNYVDEVHGLAADIYGNAYVTGVSYGSGTGYDICTIKYDNSTGNTLWTDRYTGTSNGTDYGSGIVTDNNLNVFVSGYSNSPATAYDCITIKYSQLLGTGNHSGKIPDNFSLSQNYPNPFNPNTILRFALSKGREQKTAVRLIVYNSIGQEIETLVNSALQPGEYAITFDASRYSGGLFFYSLFADGKLIDTKKMMLVK